MKQECRKHFIQEVVLICFLVAAFILIRSIHFSQFLNFSADQGRDGLRILEIYRNHEITLIGPPLSASINGREAFFSSASYYFELVFLLLGKFDPLVSSYLFMLAGALCLPFLYLGTKKLADKNVAVVICAVYSFLPIFVSYTRFLWNPNFQLILVPLAVYFLSLKKTFPLAVLLGFMALFHYTFFLPIFLIFIYMVIVKRIGFKSLVLFTMGVVIGFSPMLIFELRNDFYNIRTLLLATQNSFTSTFPLHYYLGFLLLTLIPVLRAFKKHLTMSASIILYLLLFGYSITVFLPKPDSGFGMAQGWSYLSEEKANHLIVSNNPGYFNVVNLEYNTLAYVQKYLLEKDNIRYAKEDYNNNDFLFIISRTDKYMDNPAYEVNTFNPHKLINKWQISGDYNLYLLERLDK